MSKAGETKLTEPGQPCVRVEATWIGKVAVGMCAVASSAFILTGCGEPGAAKDDVVVQQIPPLGELPPLPTSYFPPEEEPTPEVAPQPAPPPAAPAPVATPLPAPAPQAPTTAPTVTVTHVESPPAAPQPGPVEEAIAEFIRDLT